MRRALHAVFRGIVYALNFWWAGVVYMAAGVDITEPEEAADGVQPGR